MTNNMFIIIDETGNPASQEWIKNNPDKVEEQKSRFKVAEIRIKANLHALHLPIDNYYDNAIRFYEVQPYFYDKSRIFWFWNYEESRYEIKDETDVMSLFDKILGFKGQTVSNKTKSCTLEAMQRVGRDHVPKPAERKWVQFKDKAYSIFNGKIHKVTHDYFFTNPIPWELGKSDETPVMDKLFEEWVGVKNKQLLYEIIAYCCYADYPIHRIFCVVGSGSNGKSKFLALIRKFLGKDNCCASELDDLINNRFESFKLYRKLYCEMGETNFGILNKTSLLKKLSGQDMIGFEKKNKDPFNDYNYAKIIISSNSLPVSEDNTDGFYRRWTIISFDNQFPEGKDILETIPAIEYNNLCLKCVKILKNLIESGVFTNQGTIIDRKEKYLLASNPLSLFIKEHCKTGVDLYANYGELYTVYIKYLNENKKRRIKSGDFKKALEDEGFWVEKTTKKINDSFVNGLWVEGIQLCANCEDYAHVSTPLYAGMVGIEKHGIISTISTKTPKIDENVVNKSINEEFVVINDNNLYPLDFQEKYITYHKCTIENCTETECNLDAHNVPYCRKHWPECAARKV